MTTASQPLSPASSEQASNPSPPRVADCLRCVVFNVIFFAFVAPPIGGIVFMTSASIVSGELSLVNILLGFYFFSFVGYAWFCPAAAVTGAVVASASIWISRPLPLYILAVVTAAVGTGIWVVQFVGVKGPLTGAFFLMLAGAFAAAICTRIARPFRFDGTEMYDLFKRPPSEAS
jgi:hypothetical protein